MSDSTPNPTRAVSTTGRHREGRPIVPVRRKPWDMEARREAARLDRAVPLWHVLYGIGRRRFYALPVWAAPKGMILEAATARELRHLMTAAGMADAGLPVVEGRS